MILVSDQDYFRMSKLTWTITKDGYPITQTNGKVQGIARVILGTPDGMIADHKDGNPLNNVRRNIRNCSPIESSQNRRGWRKKKIPFKGVHLDRKRNKYRAILTVCGERLQSPRFKTMLEAARAYDLMCKKHHGNFARINNA